MFLTGGGRRDMKYMGDMGDMGDLGDMGETCYSSPSPSAFFMSSPVSG